MKRINIIKNIIRAELRLAEEKKTINDTALQHIEIYPEIIELLNMDNLNVFYNNLNALKVLLPTVYDVHEADVLINEISNLLYLLLKISNESEEYQQNYERLEFIVNKITNDYEILNNKLITYKREVELATKDTYKYTEILYRLNNGIQLHNLHNVYIKEILERNNVSREEQIFIWELIDHHNARCKYENPKIGYTTINMLGTDYELYDTDDLIDKNNKDILDEWINVVYESIMAEENTKLAFELFESNTSWMNDDQIDYAMRVLLNKFITLLNGCKTNMLEKGNYEDEEIRKVIISEYKTYYYRFKILFEHYNSKLNMNNVKINNLEVKNNLFFAMTSNKAYAERDIGDVPEEYYQRVKKLLEGFKYGTLSEHNNERFSNVNNLSSYRKLKDDQIRIVYRHIDNNNYLILGIIVKKSQVGAREYARVIGRDYKYTITEESIRESEEIYTNLIEYLEEYSRKGNR